MVDAKVIFVIGGPGAGKGTNCTKLKEDLGFSHLSAGDLLRGEVASGSETGKQIDGIMKEGKLVPLEITCGLLRKAMEANPNPKGFLIDGYPRSIAQLEAFEEKVCKAKRTLFFDCPEDQLEKRLLARAETSGRSDDNIEVIKKRFKTYKEESAPVVDVLQKAGTLITVDTSGDFDATYTKVKTALEAI
eukprot:TRINITY_DN105243_c0_g1_i1.p1 TRINITY_DN105243_c0_g1~~TRINITY_DN105243_c0_g1_i1.p1  ORF type:complete len:196 (-),score=28.62 TRINITY_DN105243_c0_g1_i1:137-703(-)